MLAAVLGAAITSWVTFVPSFLFIFVGAPYIEAMRRSARLHAALSSVTAAVVGVILTLALWFGMHVVFDEVGSMRIGPLSLAWPDPATFQPVSFALAVLSAVALLRFRLGLGWLLLSAAGAGALFAPGMPPR